MRTGTRRTQAESHLDNCEDEGKDERPSQTKTTRITVPQRGEKVEGKEGREYIDGMSTYIFAQGRALSMASLFVHK